MTKKITKQEYDKRVSEMAQSNHMWLNALACIHPTQDLKIQIGEWVLKLLNDKENLLSSSGIESANKTIREVAELTPILYLSINKS